MLQSICYAWLEDLWHHFAECRLSPAGRISHSGLQHWRTSALNAGSVALTHQAHNTSAALTHQGQSTSGLKHSGLTLCWAALAKRHSALGTSGTMQTCPSPLKTCNHTRTCSSRLVIIRAHVLQRLHTPSSTIKTTHTCASYLSPRSKLLNQPLSNTHTHVRALPHTHTKLFTCMGTRKHTHLRKPHAHTPATLGAPLLDAQPTSDSRSA